MCRRREAGNSVPCWCWTISCTIWFSGGCKESLVQPRQSLPLLCSSPPTPTGAPGSPYGFYHSLFLILETSQRMEAYSKPVAFCNAGITKQDML